MKTGLHITTKNTGKMEGIDALSTSRSCNKNCYYNSLVPGSVCQKCYAARTLARYRALDKALMRNYELLTKNEIPADFFPVLNARYFRLEQFGDLENALQVKNYFTFSNKNPRTVFALWTKNPHVIAQALKEGAEKPKNLVIIYSSLYLNKLENGALKKYSFIDKVFTVWTRDGAKAAGVKINCGGRRCLHCGRCYSRRTGNAINEILK